MYLQVLARTKKKERERKAEREREKEERKKERANGTNFLSPYFLLCSQNRRFS